MSSNLNSSILDINEHFDFSQIQLSHPTTISGNTFFTKLSVKNKPFYIQIPSCLSKQGIVKNGNSANKYYCDLLISNQSTETIQWFEQLESTCQSLLLNKNADWFLNSLTQVDLEDTFVPVIRLFMSGKYYLIRVNIRSTQTSIAEPAIKIFNEAKQLIPPSEFTKDSKFAVIVEIQGIRFSSKSFQMDIQAKQMLLLPEEEVIFEKCLFKNIRSPKISKIIKAEIAGKNNNDNNDNNNNGTNNYNIILQFKETEQEKEEKEEKKEEKEEKEEKLALIPYNNKIENNNINNTDNNSIHVTNEDIANNDDNILDENAINNNNYNDDNEEEDLVINNNYEEGEEEDMKEVDLDFNDDENQFKSDNNDINISLKHPKQVYFEKYQEAREKAKQLKQAALLAILEAKRIKKQHLIQIPYGEESDIDEEIDAMSEIDDDYA